MDIEHMAKELTSLICKDLLCQGILVYGSYSDKTNTRNSDFDILAVVAEDIEQRNIIHRNNGLLVHMQLIGCQNLRLICVEMAKNYLPEIICYGTIVLDSIGIFNEVRKNFKGDKLFYRKHHLLFHYEKLISSISRIKKGIDWHNDNFFDIFECLKAVKYLDMCLSMNPIKRAKLELREYKNLFDNEEIVQNTLAIAISAADESAAHVLKIIVDTADMIGDYRCDSIEKAVNQRLRHTYIWLESQGKLSLRNGDSLKSMYIVL